MAEERIAMQNPNTGRQDGTIAVSIYEPTRDAILEALDGAGKLPNAQLVDEVLQRTDTELWRDDSAMWFTTTVKLHLEATGLLAKAGSPQVLSLTEAGEAALAER